MTRQEQARAGARTAVNFPRSPFVVHLAVFDQEHSHSVSELKFDCAAFQFERRSNKRMPRNSRVSLGCLIKKMNRRASNPGVLGLSLLLMTTAACGSRDSQVLRDEPRLAASRRPAVWALGSRKPKGCDLRDETYSL